MAIEVLQRGIPPMEKTYTATCTKCMSMLKFKRSDGKWHADQRDGNFIEIKCPVCENAVYTTDEQQYRGIGA